jgi:hypothetical protein
MYFVANASELYRFFFPPLRLLPRVALAPLFFWGIFEKVDLFGPPLPRVDLRPLDFLPRAAPLFDFPPLDLLPADAFDFVPPFLAALFAPPRFFEEDDDDFLPPAFDALFAAGFAFAAAALTAFLAAGATEVLAAARRPTTAPITPPTTVPTGPATLPSTAPAAAPAACLEMGGISMFSELEPEVSLDC